MLLKVIIEGNVSVRDVLEHIIMGEWLKHFALLRVIMFAFIKIRVEDSGEIGETLLTF